MVDERLDPAAGHSKNRSVELGRFLRRHRAKLEPSDVGIPTGGRRNVPGLRREEVAALANIGVSWYTMLEQGHVSQASERTIAALGDALQLTISEREHFLALATGAVDDRNLDRSPPPPELRGFVESVTFGIAFIVSPRFDIVSFNREADTFFNITANGPEPNLLRIMLADRAMRERFIEPTWHDVLRSMVGHFRMWLGRVGDSTFDELIESLLPYPEFEAIWCDRTVTAPPSERTRIVTKPGTEVVAAIMSFTSFTCPSYTIVIKVPVAAGGTESIGSIAPRMDAEVGICARTVSQRRAELGAFLRQRRERTRPQDVGLASSGRRHIKGLRRDEVADRAGISSSWYTMLEQGRVDNVLPRTLASIARALLLTHRERTYLERLAALSFSKYEEEVATPNEDLIAFVRSYAGGSAHFHDADFDMVAWNDVAERFYAFDDAARPNLLDIMVHDERLRRQFVSPTWEATLRRMLAHYRFTHALFGGSESDPRIDRLSRRSPDFAAAWTSERAVSLPLIEAADFVVPDAGPRRLNVFLLTPNACPTYILVIKQFEQNT